MNDATDDAWYYHGLALDLARRPEYQWAADFLVNVAATIERTGQVTFKQKESIEHIILGRLKHDVRTP